MPGDTQSIKELTEIALQAERSDDNDKAIQLYKDIIAKDPLHIQAYDRLMMLYRRKKAYKNEFSVIKTAIKVYEGLYNAATKKPSQKVRDISAKLNKSFGLVDKQGKAALAPNR